MLMTGEQYVESMRKLNLQVYMFGKKIENPVDDPILRPSLNSVKATYDLAQMPEYEDLMTVKSSINGEKINRFTHIHQSTEDLIKKVSALFRLFVEKERLLEGDVSQRGNQGFGMMCLYGPRLPTESAFTQHPVHSFQRIPEHFGAQFT